MKHREAEELFIDLLEATLEPAAEQEINRHLEDCAQCRESLQRYRATIALAQSLSARTAPLSPGFSRALRARLEPVAPVTESDSAARPALATPPARLKRRVLSVLLPGSTLLAAALALVIAGDQEDYGRTLRRRLLLETAPKPAQPAPPPAAPQPAPVKVPETVEVLKAAQRIEEGARLEPFMFGVQAVPADRVPEGAVLAHDKENIVGKFAKTTVNPDLPVVSEYISDVRPISALTIPPGFRAVTVKTDTPSSVEGFASPNSRVDVLWSYKDRSGLGTVSTIVRFAKVLSASGKTDGVDPGSDDDAATTTLLVAEEDAKKIEVAARLGSLNLSLVGQEEPDKLAAETPEPVNIDSILGKQASGDILAKKQAEPHTGVIYTSDNRDGKPVRYLLRGGRWTREGEDPGAQAESSPPADPASAASSGRAPSAPTTPLYVLRTIEIELSESERSFVRSPGFIKVVFTPAGNGEPLIISEKAELISVSTKPEAMRVKLVLRLNQDEAKRLDERREGTFTLLPPEAAQSKEQGQ